jgi:hypothetical protein
LLITTGVDLINGATSAPRLLLEDATVTQLEMEPMGSAGEPGVRTPG